MRKISQLESAFLQPIFHLQGNVLKIAQACHSEARRAEESLAFKTVSRKIKTAEEKIFRQSGDLLLQTHNFASSSRDEFALSDRII